jgi:hypothetical protein
MSWVGASFSKQRYQIPTAATIEYCDEQGGVAVGIHGIDSRARVEECSACLKGALLRGEMQWRETHSVLSTNIIPGTDPRRHRRHIVLHRCG